MPETFGTGTAGSSYDPRMIPFPRVVHHLASGEVWTWTPTENNLWVVTAVDLVSDGGGGAGFISMEDAATGKPICVFNIGSSSDSFSWRGWYAIPYGPAGALTFVAVTGQGVSVHINGFTTSLLTF